LADEPTVRQYTYNPIAKVLNAAASTGLALGLPIGTLEMEPIIAAAKKSTGLDDTHGDAFLKPFEVLIGECQRMPFTSMARIFEHSAFFTAVKNRLLVEDYIKKHPEVLDIPIERPIFVLGFPRTGTTLLQNLLSLDDNTRALEFWELIRPVPLHDDPEIDQRRRIRMAQATLFLAYRVAPEMGAIHEIRSTTAEECWPLFYNTFSSLNQDLQSGMKGFGDYLLNEHDMTPPYREYRRYLQVLLHRRPSKRLVLKCPEHLWFVPNLLEVFPDACVVWTHRDPLDSVASYCSLISLQWRMLYGLLKPKEIGAHISDRFTLGVERAMAARDNLGSDHFLDVNFQDLVPDPKRIVRQIHERFDLSLDDNMDAKMVEWLNNKRADKKGAHKYNADVYGLEPEDIYTRFAPYIARYGISIRGAGARTPLMWKRRAQ
jgi:hypothetical protein